MEQRKECWPLSQLSLQAHWPPSAGLPVSQRRGSLYQPLATQPCSSHRKGTHPLPGRKAGPLPAGPSFLLALTAHLPTHTKDFFRNWLPRLELFNKAFCFVLFFL